MDFDPTVTGIASQPFWLFRTDEDGMLARAGPPRPEGERGARCWVPGTVASLREVFAAATLVCSIGNVPLARCRGMAGSVSAGRQFHLIEFIFTPLGLIPSGPRHANVGQGDITLNYTTVLNVVFLLLAAVLLWRFLTTGGR